MKALKEFKDFAVRGNVVDMAVGVIIGGAFGKIISSLVNDVIMPPVGLLLGNVDFAEFSFVLREATAEAAAVEIKYGLFFTRVIDFVIVAACIFSMVRAINRLKQKEEAAPKAPTTKECPECCSSVPIKAKRCAHCASPLPGASA